jgi:hypothetical protein
MCCSYSVPTWRCLQHRTVVVIGKEEAHDCFQQTGQHDDGGQSQRQARQHGAQ